MGYRDPHVVSGETPITSEFDTDIEVAPSEVGSQLITPRSFDAVQLVADRYLDGELVFINLEKLERKAGLRFIDFCSGLVYASGGDFRKVRRKLFLLDPPNSKVEPADVDLIVNEATRRI